MIDSKRPTISVREKFKFKKTINEKIRFHIFEDFEKKNIFEQNYFIQKLNNHFFTLNSGKLE
jgi:hypothetical protein